VSLQATCHVIGAGVAGLVAALRLAQSGRQVVLLADGSARRIAASPLAWRDPAKRPPG